MFRRGPALASGPKKPAPVGAEVETAEEMAATPMTVRPWGNRGIAQPAYRRLLVDTVRCQSGMEPMRRMFAQVPL